LKSFVMFCFYLNSITYSMGEVFLAPMMSKLDKLRGPVSTIFGMLPAVTLGAGKFRKYENWI